MAVAIRGSTPATAVGTGAVSVTLTGTRQPQTGDVLLIIHGNDYYQLSNMSTPTVGGSTTGVAAVTGTGLPADGGNLFAHIKPYTYVVGSTGDLTVAAVETGSADEDKGLAVFVLSGVDTTTPIDVAGGNFDSTGTATTRVCPSVTATTSNGFAVYHTNTGGGAAAGPYTWPGGTTEQYDTGTGGMSFSGATEQLSASGATGTRTATGAAGSASYATVTIVMRTASGGSTVNGTATLAAAGTVTAKAVQVATVTLAASSTLAAAAVQAARATFAGSGAASALATLAAPAGLAGAGTLSASAVVVPPGGRITPRPFTGTTSRPNSGITPRPFAGVTVRP